MYKSLLEYPTILGTTLGDADGLLGPAVEVCPVEGCTAGLDSIWPLGLFVGPAGLCGVACGLAEFKALGETIVVIPEGPGLAAGEVTPTEPPFAVSDAL